MDSYSVMVMADPLSPVRRYRVPKVLVRRLVWIAAALAVLFSAASWDYWRQRTASADLALLRIVSAEQRQQIQHFDTALKELEAELARIQEFERKVRIIVNLPGLAAVGGAEVTVLAPPSESVSARNAVLRTGVNAIGRSELNRAEALQGRGGAEEEDLVMLSPLGPGAPEAPEIFALDLVARRLAAGLQRRAESLADLVAGLGSKHHKLASMPSIWPTRGWLTSLFGYRTSPFTGRSQHHAGIDIATEPETPILAPATGRVAFVGTRGPLGNAVVLDHGYGVRTFFGHAHEIHVKVGDEVDRGQLIASVGNSGRSTGPHLHYSVEVGGKSVNPMNYIFD